MRAWAEGSENFFWNYVIPEDWYSDDDWLSYWMQEFSHV